MQVVHPRCCGVDIHQKTVVAWVLLTSANGHVQREVRTFGTMTADRLARSDWLTVHEVTQIAMESTGVLWRPVFNLLEEQARTLVLRNPQHLTAVPGRKPTSWTASGSPSSCALACCSPVASHLLPGASGAR